MIRSMGLSLALVICCAVHSAWGQPVVSPNPGAPSRPLPKSTAAAQPTSGVVVDPRLVDLTIHFMEVSVDLKLPLLEKKAGGVLTNEEVARVLEVCKADRQTKILSEPRMRLNVGLEGRLRTGTEFPVDVPESAKKPAVGAKPAIETRFIGTAVDATVTIPKPELFRVSLTIEQSNPAADQKAAGGISRYDARRVQTVTELASGQTLLLRGLQSRRTTAATTSVPVVGEIPVVGQSFTKVNHETVKTELMLLVTPVLIEAEPAQTP